MMRIKAGKKSLYNLVSQYTDLPPMNKTNFTKGHRARSYWLEWITKSNTWATALFSAGAGMIFLSITEKELGADGKEVSYVCHRQDAADLMERGMMEDHITTAERRKMGQRKEQ